MMTRQLGINPSGSGSGSGKAVSLFFHLLANQRTGAYEAVYVLAKFQVLNQLKLGNIRMERKHILYILRSENILHTINECSPVIFHFFPDSGELVRNNILWMGFQ